jgi:uncharacterized protein (DUF302 family)
MKTYGFSIQAGRNFDRAVEVVKRELKKKGFGVVSDIDVQALFREKLAIHDPRYRILGTCNPMLAHQALRVDPDIGLLLPCNVVIRESRDGTVVVSFSAPEAMLEIVGDDNLTELGIEVRRRFEKVSDAIGAELGSWAA